jgi:hypothetical protein
MGREDVHVDPSSAIRTSASRLSTPGIVRSSATWLANGPITCSIRWLSSAIISSR